MIKVIIAEDHQSLVDGLILHLAQNERIDVIDSVNDGESLFQLLDKKTPDVILMDIRMPKIDGIEATRKILEVNPDIKIIAFTMFDQEDAVKQMIKAGAKGYLLKNSSLEEVKKAIEIVYNGENYFDQSINSKFFESNSSELEKKKLTPRQYEILKLVGQGMTSREIADELNIGVYTVDTHRKNMKRILGLKGNGELLRYAVEAKYDF